jgi:hypothetical protein
MDGADYFDKAESQMLVGRAIDTLQGVEDELSSTEGLSTARLVTLSGKRRKADVVPVSETAG